MADKTGSSNRSSSRAHYRSSWPNESKVCITVINSTVKKNNSFRPQHTQTNLAVSTNKCDIDGQPEIALWPSKPEVLISATVWQTSLQFRRQTFYQGEFAESVNRLSSTTTGNSDVAAKTGNSYITGTTTDSDLMSASRVFLTIAGPNNVSRSYCDNVRQPEMALRSTKPEILYCLNHDM